MSWRERVLLWCGPGMLAGITFGDWLALLRENGFAVDPPYWSRAAVATLSSIGNSVAAWCERAVHGRAIAGATVEPPVFVLGIWRSGTTHLQNLLAVDQRLATPNWYQVFYPRTFLTTEPIVSRIGGFLVPRRRFQDNVPFGFAVPAEEEFALSVTTGYSPMLSWVFPRRAEHYDRYLTLREVPDAEVAAWKAALLGFVRKLSWKHRKPIILKSPVHTARIRLLLEVFPDARFVHIHRDPYTVIQSAWHTTRTLLDYLLLQRSVLDVEERTIRQYREVYDAFFEERDLIETGRFQECRFEDLEADPVGQLERIYEGLGLPDFAAVAPAVRRYVSTLRGYRKNTYPPMAPDSRDRIARECRRCFQAWDYPV